MRSPVKSGILLLACSLACLSSAQDSHAGSVITNPGSGTAPTTFVLVSHSRKPTLDVDERLSVIAAALDSKHLRYAEHDCSHLVHAIYERAGFSYPYASSDDIYDGATGFQRVSHPEPGDLVAWHGHVGIVIRPSRHAFFSFLSAGPGIDDYSNRYWRSRGKPRFYRYVKNESCTACTASVR
ncbi:MAG: CHAP domain-containing protein [Candidatus Sulfotelmatobacter sp.]